MTDLLKAETLPQSSLTRSTSASFRAKGTPEALFPTDNTWGVPLLLLEGQGDYVDLPFLPWGQVSRRTKHRGTYHFYVDDRRFSSLWSRPAKRKDSLKKISKARFRRPKSKGYVSS